VDVPKTPLDVRPALLLPLHNVDNAALYEAGFREDIRFFQFFIFVRPLLQQQPNCKY